MDVFVRKVVSKEDFDAIFKVRKIVFVQEQQVSEEEEYDEFETTSTHLMAEIKGECVGTMRFRTTEKGVKFERFAVLKTFRNQKIGKALLLQALQLVSADAEVYLHAQIQVVGFYSNFGFQEEGALFYEAGISHKKMKRFLS